MKNDSNNGGDMRTVIGPWEILTDEEVDRGWMCVYNYGRIYAHPHDLSKAIKAVAKLEPPNDQTPGRTMVELEPTQKLEVVELEELSDACGLCNTTMRTRDGMEPTKVCDACAQGFYARLTDPETLRKMSVEITEALISRIPDVHAIYAEYIQRETLKEINEIIKGE